MSERPRAVAGLTVRQKMRAGERKWYGPRLGLVLCLFFLNCMYFTLFLTTASGDRRAVDDVSC